MSMYACAPFLSLITTLIRTNTKGDVKITFKPCHIHTEQQIRTHTPINTNSHTHTHTHTGMRISYIHMHKQKPQHIYTYTNVTHHKHTKICKYTRIDRKQVQGQSHP